MSYSSASAADVTITPSTGSVTLMDGQTEASITVDITDDAIPEETESLQIELTSASGEGVLPLSFPLPSPLPSSYLFECVRMRG